MFELNKYHLDVGAGRDLGYEFSAINWIAHHAKKFAEEIDSAREEVMELCDDLCKGKCIMKQYSSKEIHANPELARKCKFPFDILHLVLHDGYPVNPEQAGAYYQHITGHPYHAGK